LDDKHVERLIEDLPMPGREADSCLKGCLIAETLLVNPGQAPAATRSFMLRL
jgi:hypothetical protein